MAEVGRISPSKLAVCFGCPMAFFLKYIKHARVPTSINLIFGREVHYMLESFYKKNYKSSESFANSFAYRWKRVIAGDFLNGKEKEELKITEYPYFIRGENREKKEMVVRIGSHVKIFGNPLQTFFSYKSLGKGIMRRFYERHHNKNPPLYKEMSFGKKEEEKIDIGGHLVTGIIDRIDRIDGKYYITDYKTDKTSPAMDSFVLHRNPQFSLYSYVFRKLFGEKETAILYYHLRTGQVLKTHRSERDYDYLMSLLDKFAEIVSSNSFTPYYGHHCFYCDYKVPCEQYSVGRYFGGPRIDLEGKISGAEFFDWDSEVPEWMESDIEER